MRPTLKAGYRRGYRISKEGSSILRGTFRTTRMACSTPMDDDGQAVPQGNELPHAQPDLQEPGPFVPRSFLCASSEFGAVYRSRNPVFFQGLTRVRSITQG